VTRIAIFLAVLVMAACARGAAGDVPPDTGIQGKTVIGPQCPVETQASPCPDKPFPADIEIVHARKVVKRVHSGENGFRVFLASGTYVLRAADTQPGSLPFLKPVSVRVHAHRFTTVTLQFDSGIR
jgi:hypothetical protein